MPTAQARHTRRFVTFFVVVAFLVLSIRSEGITRRLDREAWDTCQQRRANIQQTIQLRRDISALDERVAAIYARYPLTVPTCGEKP